MNKKKIAKSKTIWFNMLIAMLAVLSANIELLRGYMDNGGYVVVLMIISGVGVYLRSVTNQGVGKWD